LKKHALSGKHKTTFYKWNSYLSTQNELNKNKSVANLVNFQRKAKVIENRKHIYFLLKATIFLCKQDLAFRGHNESLESTNRGNFVELLDSFANKNLQLNVSRRYGQYTLPDYQNDFISIVAQKIFYQKCQA